MKLLGTDAVGLADRDLRFGIAYLRAQIKRTQLPMVCANLMDKRTKTTAIQPYLI
jgi:2',3'-cyclic-nucleotide 2'-phosphodiesterase (5'-nucleotidase family)